MKSAGRPKLPCGLLASLAASILVAGCSIDEADEIADTWMHGSIFGSAWKAGPGAVHVNADDSAIVRIFEAGAVQDACSADPTKGRRIEITMGRFQTGRYEAATDAPWIVEAWNERTGLRDAYSLIQIDLAQRQVGGELSGRARFGSAQSGDLVEGHFEATVCSIDGQ
jgi:hypothetical protein